MKNITLKVAALAFVGLSFYACSDDDSNNTAVNATVTKKEVVENYANIVHANYQKAYEDAVLLQTAINTFTETPTADNFAAAKTKWKDSRESYGTTEAFRFAGGPIDEGDNAPEAYLNAWPLDENYIDYVQGNPNAGIVNATVIYPTITKELLKDLNEGTNAGNSDDNPEKNISIGYHAIEFLLWGQDLTSPDAKLPGQRAYTDYVTGGTALNPERRKQYLKFTAEILVEHLNYLVNQWKVGGEYRTTFLALPENTAIKNIYLGITTLVMAELPVERMEVALENALEDPSGNGQEDEHSCFSDNTHRDIILNLQGVINVYQGKYGSIDGPSLEDLVNQADAATATETNNIINQSATKASNIAIPFDYAIFHGPETQEGAKVKDAATTFKNLGTYLLAGATKIGIIVNE